MPLSRKTHSLTFILNIIFLAAAQAQTSAPRETVSQPIEWFAISSNVKLSKSFSLFLDIQPRFVGDFELMQFQARIGGDFKINDWFSFMPIGYVYVVNPLYGVQPAAYATNEHRIFQQLSFKHFASKVRFQHRLRTEERYMEFRENGTMEYQGYSNDQFRIRYRALANIPLNNNQAGSYSSSFDPGTWYLQVYDEIMMSWGEKVTYHEPDQNRIFVGAGYQFSPRLYMTGGFIWQILIKSNGAKQENNVGSSINLVYNFDFTKK